MIRFLHSSNPDKPIVVNDATTNESGLMPFSDKAKLNTISSQDTLFLSNFINGGLIGDAEQTVDITSLISINQTTPNQILLLPTPSISSNIKHLFILNNGSVTFSVYSTYLEPNSTVLCLWNGTAWNSLISNTSLNFTNFNIIYTSGDLVIGEWNTLVIIDTNNNISITLPISNI